jgi:hypothetical protein
MNNELTEQEKLQAINTAHDSVILIKQLRAKGNLSSYELDRLADNVQNINSILAYDWFVEILTPAQKTELESLV